MKGGGGGGQRDRETDIQTETDTDRQTDGGKCHSRTRSCWGDLKQTKAWSSCVEQSKKGSSALLTVTQGKTEIIICISVSSAITAFRQLYSEFRRGGKRGVGNGGEGGGGGGGGD